MVINFINIESKIIVSYETLMDCGLKITIHNDAENTETTFAVTHGEICLSIDSQFYGGYSYASCIKWLSDLQCEEDHPAAIFVKRLVNHELRAYEKEAE